MCNSDGFARPDAPREGASLLFLELQDLRYDHKPTRIDDAVGHIRESLIVLLDKVRLRGSLYCPDYRFQEVV